MAKEFGEARCPLVTNRNIRSLHLYCCPYVDISRGKLLLLLIYSVEVRDSNAGPSLLCGKSHDLLFCAIEAC